MYTISAFILCTLAGLALAYPSGAPIETCKTFSANHTGHLPQQNTQSKYEILIAPTSVPSGESILVTLQGVNENFKGFFVQGQDATGKPIGKFTPQLDAQTRDCNTPGDSATHVNALNKSKVVLQWQAPAAYKGKVVFRAVMLKTYEIFWNNLVSSPLTVV